MTARELCWNCAHEVTDAVYATSPSATRRGRQPFHDSCLQRLQACGHDWERTTTAPTPTRAK